MECELDVHLLSDGNFSEEQISYASAFKLQLVQFAEKNTIKVLGELENFPT